MPGQIVDRSTTLCKYINWDEVISNPFLDQTKPNNSYVDTIICTEKARLFCHLPPAYILAHALRFKAIGVRVSLRLGISFWNKPSQFQLLPHAMKDYVELISWLLLSSQPLYRGLFIVTAVRARHSAGRIDPHVAGAISGRLVTHRLWTRQLKSRCPNSS
uniref:Uncharacterized protein n=1 Tax=Rhizobium rhizogenes TaxID=359 RepID=A0A7S5DQQ0_RHIRH|nr:hypothetical protein pC6.5d_676 [Rhizobium rhizogenes]